MTCFWKKPETGIQRLKEASILSDSSVATDAADADRLPHSFLFGTAKLMVVHDSVDSNLMSMLVRSAPLADFILVNFDGQQRKTFEEFTKLALQTSAGKRLIVPDGNSFLSLLHQAELEPDSVFVPGDRNYDSMISSLVSCNRNFPRAVIYGNGWFSGEPKNFPVRYAVTDFCSSFALQSFFEEDFWKVSRRDT